MNMRGYGWTCVDMCGHALTVVANITYGLVECVIKNKGITKSDCFYCITTACCYTPLINDIAASVVNRKSGQVTLLSILCYASA
jgi:hypothetical protein